jgi:hypothetical protein
MMAKAQQTNGMPTMNGRYVGLNAYDQIEAMAWTPKMVAKNADYTIKASESGTIFTNVGATKAINFTLPAITDGPFYFKILIGADYAVTVTSVVADTIITFNDAAADSVAFSQASEILGGSFEIFCNGTSLFVIPSLASEAQTIAIVTN